jgi:membrane-bound ClpP family serine protease
MPRGASPKRERQYRKIEKKLEKEGRYKGREEEVAARIVNKQRAKSGETKSAKKKRARKKSAKS